MDSTMFSAMGSLALIYDGLDSLARVVDLYERAIRLTDSAAVYLNNLAYTYAERGINLEHAKMLSERSLQADPKNASYLDTMGWIEFKLGNDHEAINWLKKALKSDPKSAPVVEHIGDVYHKRNSLSKARSYYRKALELDPANQQLREKVER
jgi:tetratricopeptide (TPR) repeat protein